MKRGEIEASLFVKYGWSEGHFMVCVNENSLVRESELLVLDVCVCVCVGVWVKYRSTNRHEWGKDRWRQKKNREKQTVRWVDRDRTSESLKVSVSASSTTEEETRHDALPPFPLKTHLLLTDEKHKASVTWTLICSSYLSRSTSIPEPIKTDNQIETERWRPAAEFPSTGVLQSVSS